MRLIDLFAGCGGLSLGFEKDGHQILKAVEFDSSIATTYQKNHPGVQVIVDDIKNVARSGAFREGEADIIIGGPPCQGFSMAGARIRGGFMDDPRNYLFRYYFEIVKTVRPKMFIMENVKGITTMKNGEIFREIQRIFSDRELMGGQAYRTYSRLAKAVDFGIPQKRERMLIIGLLEREISFEKKWEQARETIKEEEPSFFIPTTVRDAIGNLGEPSEDGLVKNPMPQTAYQEWLKSEGRFLNNHKRTRHSRQAVERMSRVAPGENYTVLGEEIKSVHSGSYGRLSWDEPAATITTRFDTPAGGRFIHPVYDRTLTPREAARIQSFPDDFVFYGNRTSICKQIGNAVPPKISYFLSVFVGQILKEW